ncbi:MAG: hypothetical protein DMG32_23645 [Acidobacteria bacterium]|nr:MAG: hypothetical protein DMG32_23645 [Acidobacteriota bacterium]
MRTIFAIFLLAFVLAFCCVAMSPRAFAHHGDAGYDTSKQVTVKGAVTEFHFQNPHIEIFIDARKDDHSIEKWHGELNSPNLVSRMAGWNGKTLKPGDEIVLIGYRAKNGLNVLRLEKVLLANGTEIFPKNGNGVTVF